MTMAKARIAVIGAGLMGHGIAQVLARGVIGLQDQHVVAAQVGQAADALQILGLSRHADRMLRFGQRWLVVDVAAGDLHQPVGGVGHEQVFLAVLDERHHVKRLVHRAELGDRAADGLGALAEQVPDVAHVHFFLGISELMSDNVSRARGALQRSADSGVNPYADEAHFYLAKVAIRTGDLTTAARELQIAVERDAGPDGDAARLLAEVSRANQ